MISQIHETLKSSHRILKWRLNISSIFGALLVVAVLLLVLLGIEQQFYLPASVKTLYWILSLALAIFSARHIRNRFQLPEFIRFYRSAADHIHLPKLRHIMDLSLTKETNDSELREAAIEQNLEHLSTQEPVEKLKQYLRHHPLTQFLRRIQLASAGAFLLLIVSLLFFGDAFQRSSTFWISYQKPIPFDFTVSPGDTTVEQGSRFKVVVDFRGDKPETVRLGLRSEQEEQPRLQGMTLEGDDSFESRESELFDDVEYFLEMDGYRSEMHKVNVELLPRLQNLSVTAIPPDYTGRDSETHTYPFNRLDAPVGSRIIIESESNKPLDYLEFVSEQREDTLSVEPEGLINTEFTALEDDRFHFAMRDGHGLKNSNPFRFRLSVIPDRPPHVAILSPDTHVHEFITEEVPLLYEFEDDYGFTSVELHYQLDKAFIEIPVEGMIALDLPQRNQGMGEYDWDIRDMGLTAMDQLEYWIEITDNNEFDGYQTTRSATHTIEIPSLASRIFDQEEQEEEIENRFSEVEESYQRMQQDMDQLREQIRDRPDDQWEQSQLLEDIQEQRKGIEEQIEEMQRQFDELTSDLESQDLMSDETIERYRELQDLMDEIDDPDILRLLEQMQENLGEFDQRQMRENLDDIEFNEERYRERLERTMDLFKSLRLDADLDKMSKMLEDLEERESLLSEQDSYGEEEIRQQEQIREELQQLSEKIEELPEKSPDRRREQMEQMSDDFSRQMEELNRQLQDNLEQMQEGESDPSELRQQQQDMSQDMGEMAEQLSSMKSEMQQETLSINIQALEYILETLILLSEEQEDVVNRTSNLTSNSPGFIEQARRQRNISGQFSMITDSLYQVSTEIPQFSNRINDRKREVQRHMERAVDYLIDRNRSNATAEERFSLGGLNEIGSMLADLLDQLNQMENGGGDGMMSMDQMMDQLQDMSQDQQQLNQEIQDYINDIQGERLSRDHMERLEQMAREQNRIREEMNRIQQNSGRGGDRLMSEIERLTEEMEDAINDLRGGSTDDLTVERQQNILSRMLEVEDSVHKRDEDEEERLGETAEDYDTRDITEMTMEELREQIRSNVEQTDYTRFRSDYQELIERYFQLMEEYMENPVPQTDG